MGKEEVHVRKELMLFISTLPTVPCHKKGIEFLGFTRNVEFKDIIIIRYNDGPILDRELRLSYEV